jgi:GT2 family glycosyltransferase
VAAPAAAPAPAAPLTWSLVIATKDRPDALAICIRLALAQTRPPAEVVVVDASAAWEDHAAAIRALMAEAGPGIPLHVLRAEAASLTVQRNQGIAQAQAPVLFLIDDDSFMYPDCAAQVMRIYEADAAGLLGGVQTSVAPLPPEGAGVGGGARKQKGSQAIGAGGHRRGPLRRWLMQRLLLLDKAETFIPYEDRPARHPLPEALAGLPAVPVALFQGFRMTFRRAAVIEEPFDGLLRYYCPGEDIDASYRVSRRHPLATATEARLHHYAAQGGRIDRRRTTALSALNQAALLRRHAADQPRVRRLYFALMRRRLLAETLKDLLSRRWGLPQARGVLLAWPLARQVFAMSPEALQAWYPGAQERLVKGESR